MNQPPRVLERAAGEARIEIIGGLDERRRRHTDGRVDQPVFDLTRLVDRDNQRTARTEIDELDMLERGIGLGRQHDASAARQSR